MSILNKILIFLGIIVVISSLGFIIYKQHEISERQLTIESQVVKQKELKDNIIRSENSYATKEDIEKLIKSNGLNLKVIQDDLDKLDANISSVNTVTANSVGRKENNIPSSEVGSPNPNPSNEDTYGYLKATQLLNLDESFGNIKVPIGKVGFSAWQKDPWNISLLPREYQLTSVIGTDENQRQYVYNKFTVKVDNKKYEVKISSAEIKQEYPKAKWSWWNPRLFIGIDGGININQVEGEFTPNLNIGIMSYGQFKNQPDFSVLQVGAGYGAVSQRLQFVITPIAYNIGKHIPLMDNAYVSPSLQINTDGNISIMAGLRVGL